MDKEKIFEHAQKIREKSIQLVLDSPEGGLHYYEFVTKERNEAFSSQEERDFWDIAFIHGKEGLDRVCSFYDKTLKAK